MKETNEIILDISRVVSDKIGADFFKSLALELSKELSCDYAVVAEIGGDRTTANTLAFCADGKILDNINYSLTDTPCADVSRSGVCMFRSNVQNLFPKDQILKEMEAESFVGIRLSNSKNEGIGLLEILDRKPINDLKFKETLLRVFGARASAEIERLNSNNALQESENRYRSLFEVANDGYLLVDLETLTIEDCNHKALQIVGNLDKQVIIGQSVSHFYGVDEENQADKLGCSLEHLSLNITEDIQRIETRITRNIKPKLDVEITSTSVVVNNKPHAMLVIRDLSKSQKILKKLDKSRQALKLLAYTDSLTQLPNRASLQEKLKSIENISDVNHDSIFMMILDVNNFKEVNDSLGHYVGDQLLKKIAHNMLENIPEEDAFIYRLGGDEFALILENHDKAQAQDVAEELTLAIDEPFNIENIDLNIGCSIGIANYSSTITTTGELMRAADVAMYQAKNSSFVSYQFYNSEMDIYSRHRLQIISDLKPALKSGEFKAYFQPKIDLKTMNVVGFEALARWEHSKLGMISPLMFIDIAEMSNNIKELTHTILESSCKAVKKWNSQDQAISVAVNISTKVLLDDDFVPYIENILQTYDIDPNKLELEITESTLMKDPDRALIIARNISNMGVSLSVDDFGTGYSSLAYLKRFPVKTLKIDREFVKDMASDEQDKVIVRSVIGLAKNLGLDVVAEGIEDNETAVLLKAMDCHQAQGYLYGKPMPEQEISTWLENWSDNKTAIAV